MCKFQTVQSCKFGNYNSFALENTIAGADSRTKILDLNAVEKHTSQFQLHLFCSHSNIYGTFPNWRKFGLFSDVCSCLGRLNTITTELRNRAIRSSAPAISNLGISFRGGLGKQLPETHNMIYYPCSFRGSVRKHELSDLNIRFGNFRT